MTYADSSVIVKRYYEELGSGRVREGFAATERIFTSRLAYAEVHAALARKRRERALSEGEYRRSASAFEADWAAYDQISIDAATLGAVPRLVRQYSLRWMGVNDAQNPNNEFVEITLDPRYVTTPTFDMTGFVLRNNRGDAFTFPAGFQLRVGRSVRVYTGPGVAMDTELYWGLGAGVWDNTNDCARLVYPTGGSYRFGNATGACD